MELWAQITYGSLVLGICSAVHLLLIILSLPIISRFADVPQRKLGRMLAGRLVGLGFLTVVIGHIIQIWIWAFCFLWLDAMPRLEPALYFSLSTYTTLGFGDLLLGEDLRLFGAFASVNGMLIFGVSTAYLVGILGRVLPQGLQ